MSLSWVTQIYFIAALSWDWLHTASPSFRLMHRIPGNFCLVDEKKLYQFLTLEMQRPIASRWIHKSMKTALL